MFAEFFLINALYHDYEELFILIFEVFSKSQITA